MFKHVLNWKIGVRVFRSSAGDSPVAKPQSRVHPEAFGGSLAACSRLTRDSRDFCDWNSRLAAETRGSRLKFAARGLLATEPRDSPSRESPRNSFLMGFLWETCFKPLPSSLKPLFQYFYIKIQPIWMVFHSINISKVIINSFHYFWSLDYVLESFVLLVEIFIIGVGKT